MTKPNRHNRSFRWAFRVGATLATAAALLATSAIAANAAGAYRTLNAANIRSGPTTSSIILGTMGKGSTVTIDCYVNGQSVSGTTIWDHLVTGGYMSDSLILTYSNNPVVPLCGAYNRSAAANWALAHINDRPRYGEDCTWFVSQALWAGGLPKSNDWSDTRYGAPAPTWAAVNADYLKNYLVNQSGLGTIQQLSPTQRFVPQAQLGDIIAYDFNHDGFVDHLMIVTSASGQYPTVTGHTDAITQPWDYSRAKGRPMAQAYPGLRIYLIHIK